MGVSRPPRYAPKSRYRTRQSGAEVEDATNLSDTAIDRPVLDLEELEARAAAEAAPVAPHRAAWVPWAIVLVVVALGLGATLAVVLFLGP
jgi:hypothetical protein